jgi:glucokinase
MIVAGEIGPIETRLALCGLDMGRPVIVAEERSKNAAFVGFSPMVQRFLDRFRPPQIRAAAFVARGPIQNGVCLAGNMRWPVSASAVSSELRIDKVTLLTDVEGVAHALSTVEKESLVLLSSGDSGESGNLAVAACGAAPGVGGLYWTGTEHRSFVSEGGHADFAPSNEDEFRLALHLASHVARVSVELLLSSEGLALIHRFVRGTSHDERPALAEALSTQDPASVIIQEGTEGTDPACRRALAMFLGIYGSIAGNLALTFRATGGVYLSGSLVNALRGPLVDGTFRAAFCRKAPMQEALDRIPVHAIVDERIALLGAAAVAARDLRTQRGSGWAS